MLDVAIQIEKHTRLGDGMAVSFVVSLPAMTPKPPSHHLSISHTAHGFMTLTGGEGVGKEMECGTGKSASWESGVRRPRDDVVDRSIIKKSWLGWMIQLERFVEARGKPGVG